MEINELIRCDEAQDGRTNINQSCWLQETDGCIAIFVNGIPIMTYDRDDLTASRMAMIQLVELRVASQEEVAQAFGVKRATVYRQRKKYQQGGVKGITDKKRGPKKPRKIGPRRQKVVLKLKQAGKTYNEIAQKLGVSEFTIRATLKRLGYRKQNPVQQELLTAEQKEITEEKTEQVECEEVLDQADASAEEQEAVKEKEQTDQTEASDDVTPVEVAEARESEAAQEDEPAHSFDPDPSNRVIDRMLARLGLLQDAAPLFQTTTKVQGAGVLLAIPILAAHGVFEDAMSVFKSLGAAFYGLRNTVVTLLLCFLRGINRPENLKKHSPGALGKVMGLDRAPEMKTLRRKIRGLVSQNRVLLFIKRQTQRHLGRLDKDLLWLYVDGHVSVYSGKRKLSKHHVTRLRISLPSVLDYWVNDEKGDPVMVLSGEKPRRGMVKALGDVIKELRNLGEQRPITLVFDREGWSPSLFARLDAMEGIRLVSYRKAAKKKKLPLLGVKEFEKHEGQFDGQQAGYDLADKRIYIDYGRKKKKERLVLRQVTRRSENGKQTHVVTNDWDTPTIEIAYRMFGRWGQENFFKYMRHEKDFDGLVTYLMEEGNGDRLVSNPERDKLAKKVKKHHTKLGNLMAKYGRYALNNEEAARRTMRGFKIANGDLGQEIKQLQDLIEKLETRVDGMPAKVPVRSTLNNENPKLVHHETRRLIHAFRVASQRAETALLELLRSSYPRWRQDGRTMIRTFLNATGDIEIKDGELWVLLDEQSAPHRTLSLDHLCAELNLLKAKFPGSELILKYGVRRPANGSPSG